MSQEALMIAGIVTLVVLILFCIAMSTRNGAVALEEVVGSADSDIKVQEKRRVDLVYNLVDCVKNYDAHEAEVLRGVAEEMGNGRGNSTILHTELNAAAYQYPELASSVLYRDLMNELSMTENLISRHRENYNEAVKDYLRYVRQFPAFLFLAMTGYRKQNYQYLNYNAPVDAPQNLFDERK